MPKIPAIWKKKKKKHVFVEFSDISFEKQLLFFKVQKF